MNDSVIEKLWTLPYPITMPLSHDEDIAGVPNQTQEESTYADCGAKYTHTSDMQLSSHELPSAMSACAMDNRVPRWRDALSGTEYRPIRISRRLSFPTLSTSRDAESSDSSMYPPDEYHDDTPVTVRGFSRHSVSLPELVDEPAASDGLGPDDLGREPSSTLHPKLKHSLFHILAWKRRFALATDLDSYRRLLHGDDAAVTPARLVSLRTAKALTRGVEDLAATVEKRKAEETAIRRVCELRLEELKKQSLALASRRKCRMHLTPLERKKALHFLQSPSLSSSVIIDKFNIPITQSVLRCLEPMEWCNDEVINFYLQLLQERNTRQRERGDLVPNVYIWSSFFFTKLMDEDNHGNQTYTYANVRRWTKRKQVDLFSYDLVLVPVHVRKIHWALGVVNMKEKKILFLDSLSGPYSHHFAQHIFQYLLDEHQDKLNAPLPSSELWKMDDHETFPLVPQQTNGSDCGVFLCQFSECLTDGRGLDFSQSDIPDRRLKMVYQICTGEVK